MYNRNILTFSQHCLFLEISMINIIKTVDTISISPKIDFTMSKASNYYPTLTINYYLNLIYPTDYECKMLIKVFYYPPTNFESLILNYMKFPINLLISFLIHICYFFRSRISRERSDMLSSGETQCRNYNAWPIACTTSSW